MNIESFVAAGTLGTGEDRFEDEVGYGNDGWCLFGFHLKEEAVTLTKAFRFPYP